MATLPGHRRSPELGSDERAMDLLIDTQGRQQKCADHLPCAVWRKGFIHIRKEKQEVVVSLSPTLVRGPTVAGAVYAIAEMRPKCTSLIMEKSDGVAIIFDEDWKAACRRLCELVAGGQHDREEQTTAFGNGSEPPPEPEECDDPEQIITATLKRHVACSPEVLTRAILEQLWEAGYDVRPNH
jgi:hypothetical protein